MVTRQSFGLPAASARRAEVAIVLALAVLAAPAWAGPPCRDSGARLAADSRARRASTCGGAAGVLFVGDTLEIRAARSVRLVSPGPAGTFDVVCNNGTAAALTVRVTAGAPVRLEPPGATCGVWGSGLEYQCAHAGVADALACAAYRRGGGAAGDGALQPRAAIAVRAPERRRPTVVEPSRDPRLQAWAQDFAAGDVAKVAEAARLDLATAAPHPAAAHVFVTALALVAGEEGVQRALREGRGGRDAAVLARARALYLGSRGGDVDEEFPPSRLARVTDPFALAYLRWAARAAGRDDAVIALAALSFGRAHPPAGAAAARAGQDDYLAVWAALDVAARNPEAHAALAAAVKAADPRIAAGPTGRLLTAWLATRPPDPAQRLELIEAWLRDRPRDAAALRHKAVTLMELGRPADAAAAFGRARELYPFLAPLEPEAEALVRGGRQAEARALVARHAARGRAAAAKDFHVETTWGRALLAAGEVAAARPVVGAVGRKWPGTWEAAELRARLALADGRPQAALPFARELAGRVATTAPRRAAALALLRRAGRPDEAAAAFAREAAACSLEVCLEGGAALLAAGRGADAVTAARRALADHPRAAALRRLLAEALWAAGQRREALAELRAALRAGVPDAAAARGLRQWRATLDGAPAGEAELSAFARATPWAAAVWRELADGAPDVAARLRVWERARDANRGRLWPWEGALGTLLQARRWDEAQRLAEEAERAVGWTGPAGERLHARLLPTRVLLARLAAEPRAALPLDRAAAPLEAYRAAGGAEATFLEARAALLAARGQRAAAAQARAQARRLRPGLPQACAGPEPPGCDEPTLP